MCQRFVLFLGNNILSVVLLFHVSHCRRSAVDDEQQRNITSTSSSRRFQCGCLQLVLGNAVPGQLWTPRWVSDSYDTLPRQINY